ncbi:unnamed protein product [Chironomus riparius]|uniref:Uncharacterized protein n=1 Tax=Chironomus riparius TaxID=315576 RepID=A0A9N9WUW6_9DIPT|nr:unnamed protein product [Chironomus riparius]
MAGGNTFANHFGMFNTDPQKQLDDMMTKLQNDSKMFFDSFKNSNSITIVNETNNTGSIGDHKVLEAIRQLNLTFHNKCKSINKKLEAEVHESKSNISQQQIENILKSFNDSNNELLLKFHIIYMSLLACIILLLITIVVIMCCKKSSNLSKTDVKIDDEYKIPYNYESQQKAPENHYQMTNIVGQEVRNRENQQYSCQDQQEYEEIPENAYNKSQISNKRTGNNNDDDFYEEQPSFRDAYSHAKGKKDYACTSYIDQLYVLTSKAFKENQQNGETKTNCLEQSCDLKAITTQIEKVSTTLITLEDRLSCGRGASIKSCFDDSIKTSEEVLTKALDSIKSNVVDVIKQEISNIKGTCKECETQATNNQDKLSKGQSTNSQKSKESSLNNTFEAYDKYITILCLVILILMNAIALCCNCCKVNLLETSKDLNKSQSDHQNMQNNTKLRIEEQNEASNYSQRQENHYEVEGNYNEVNMIADAADVAEDLYSEVKIELQNNDEYEGDEQLYSTVMNLRLNLVKGLTEKLNAAHTAQSEELEGFLHKLMNLKNQENAIVMRKDVIYIIGACIIALFTINVSLLCCIIFYIKSSKTTPQNNPTFKIINDNYEELYSMPKQSQSDEAMNEDLYKIPDNYEEVLNANVNDQHEEGLYSEVVAPLENFLQKTEEDDNNSQLYAVVLNN